MKDADDPFIHAAVPDLIPDTRVRTGGRHYRAPTCLSDLISDATQIYGVTGGIDNRGIEWLRSATEGRRELSGLIILALYGGCPTWDHVLKDALEIQDTAEGRLQFKLLARRVGPDRPTNLLWFRRNDRDPGTVVIGNVSNFLVDAAWDHTDATLAVPLTTSGAEALRRYMDFAGAQSAALTPATAAAPRLVLPAGTEEGRRQWEEYLSLLDLADAGGAGAPIVDADLQTGEITAKDADGNPVETLTSSGTLPAADPVFEAVQKALAAGRLVSIDRVARPPPFAVTIPAEMFGQQPHDQIGGIHRRQEFTISLFDEKTLRTLENRRNDAATTLARFSISLQEGQRWIPNTAFPLFDKELERLAQKGAATLGTAIGDFTPEGFVQAQRDRVRTDCEGMLRQIGRTHPPDPALLDKVLRDLLTRLTANMKGGMQPKLSVANFQLAGDHADDDLPWGTVQTFLAGAAQIIRNAICNPYHFRGLQVSQKDFIGAFDILDDALVRQYRGGLQCDDRAREQLAIFKEIDGSETSTARARSNALWKLIKGASADDIRDALQVIAETPPSGNASRPQE